MKMAMFAEVSLDSFGTFDEVQKDLLEPIVLEFLGSWRAIIFKPAMWDRRRVNAEPQLLRNFGDKGVMVIIVFADETLINHCLLFRKIFQTTW